MKARCIAITLLFVLINNSFSQELKWEKTPWGSDVRTYINPEADAEYRAAGDEYYEDDYPDVTYLYPYPPYSSTDRFNCHGWAWYMSEAAGGSGYSDPRDIGEVNGTLPYISDGISYKVVSESEADIVWWSSGYHSALTTSAYRVWTSKWQYGPLVQHAWDDSPYGTSNLVFYKRCFKRLTGAFDTDITMDHCKVQFNNASVLSNVDLEVGYEDWLQIEGTFTTGTGATLDFHPNSN